MKTQFKNHIKFGSCWYDSFFKVSAKQIQNNKHKIKSAKEPINKEPLAKK